MRHYVIASHGGFSKGIYESIKIIIGEQAGVDIITAFIDGKNDIEVLELRPMTCTFQYY